MFVTEVITKVSLSWTLEKTIALPEGYASIWRSFTTMRRGNLLNRLLGMTQTGIFVISGGHARLKVFNAIISINWR